MTVCGVCVCTTAVPLVYLLKAFVVRNSQKARYALSVRLPTSDPAVSHFLIQTNQQGQ